MNKTALRDDKWQMIGVRILTLAGFLMFLCQNGFAQHSKNELHLTGVYQGKGLYVKNPYDVDNNSFCVQQVKINGKDANIPTNLTAIQIPFTGIDRFSPVAVEVKHKSNCEPKFVNPKAILYFTSFRFDSLVINDSIMHWYTKGDKRQGKFIVQKLFGGEWESLQTIHAKGHFNGAQYVYFPEHSDGGNKYRIRYELSEDRYLNSKEMEYYHYTEKVSFTPREVVDILYLSRKARYEISRDGNVIKKGEDKKINVRSLPAGNYSIELDGEMETFIKK